MSKMVIDLRTGNARQVKLTAGEVEKRQQDEVAWELAKNTKAAQDANRQTIQSAREEVLDALILAESSKPQASQAVKDAAGIIRGRG